MIRVMVIDDEPTARKLLISTIDWEKMGLELVGEASNGIEAINVIDDMQPEIAFVDISMPFMDGIEFTKIATQRYPGLKIIILTAFDDFEYARECIKLPVIEYLLKPIDKEEVEKALDAAKKQVCEEREEQKETEEEAKLFTEKDDMPIKQITAYLDTNFTDSTINLASVSQRFGFNSSYLSRKFKNETGKSFIEYLTGCRMEKAIELAKNNEKMFFTAGAVGIPDPNYFGRCFKKHTGFSYSEYVARNKH